MTDLNFPQGFIFGTATAAYQIEGAVDTGGRGPSIWDEFCHRDGNIYQNHNGDVACDHYHRYQEDTLLMHELGVNAYRMSLSWSRILPQGTGSVNQIGIDHYKKEIDGLLEAGITPYVTLFHWDLPLELHNRYGGFQNRQIAYDFAKYAEVVAKELGDRVKNFITLNEPWEHCLLGHAMGAHAPGYKRPWTYWKVMQNLLLAHAMGADAIREVCPDANVGITLSLTPIHSASASKKDQQAAKVIHEFHNGLTLDPLLKGYYPEDFSRRLRWFSPDFQDGDMDRIHNSSDFIGVNTYYRWFARHSYFVPFLNALLDADTNFPDREFVKNGVQYTSMGWEVYPECVYEILKLLQDEYDNPPVLVTENGAAYEDEVVDGEIDDSKRIEYFDGHLRQVKRAMDEGANVSGYFAWTLLDNFEWTGGYAKRFGLIHVDHETQKRIIKKSGRWYSEVIRRSRSG